VTPRLLGAIAFALLTALPRGAAATEPSDFAISPEGHPFRVRFDPASRLSLGVAGAAARSPEGRVAPTLEINAGLSYRFQRDFYKGPARVVWQVDQRFFSGWVAPLVRPFRTAPALDAALYMIAAHRHDQSPRIVLPVSPPLSVPFPFDVGMEAEAGRVWIPRFLPPTTSGSASPPFLRVGVVRASAFLDPWRSDKPGRSLEIGVGVRYDMDLHAGPKGTLDAPRVVHRVAPGTAGSLRFRYQTDDGLLVLDLRGEVVPHWTSEGRWVVGALASAHVERTLLAVNDQPITLVFEGGYRRVPPALQEAALNDMRLSLGLVFAWQLR
jgi:hypothetical protein